MRFLKEYTTRLNVFTILESQMLIQEERTRHKNVILPIGFIKEKLKFLEVIYIKNYECYLSLLFLRRGSGIVLLPGEKR